MVGLSKWDHIIIIAEPLPRNSYPSHR